MSSQCRNQGAAQSRSPRHGVVQLSPLGVGAQMTRCAARQVGWRHVGDGDAVRVAKMDSQRVDRFADLAAFCASFGGHNQFPGVEC